MAESIDFVITRRRISARLDGSTVVLSFRGEEVYREDVVVDPADPHSSIRAVARHYAARCT